MNEQEIDARMSMAQSDLNKEIQRLYTEYGPGIMNITLMESIPAFSQTVLLFYPDPDVHAQMKDILLEMLGDTMALVSDASPATDAEIDALATNTDVVN